jgi:hypothetical protein
MPEGPPGGPQPCPAAAQRAFDAAVHEVRNVAPSAESREQAWFALRLALALEDAELLAAADVLAGRVGPGWGEQAVVARLARARSDSRMECKAMASFLAAAEPLPDGPEAAAAILAAASVLEGATLRNTEGVALALWAAQRLERLVAVSWSAGRTDAVAEPLLVHAALALVKSGAIAVPTELPSRLAALGETRVDNVWLWALAHDVFADERFKALALAASRPQARLADGLALLRLYQLTGDLRWVAEARRMVAAAPNSQLPDRDTALLMAELEAPELAILPPYPLPPG